MHANARRTATRHGRSGEKLQPAKSTKTTAMSRLFPLRRAYSPARQRGRERAVDEFALAGPSNKSVRIGFVQKAPPSFSPPGEKVSGKTMLRRYPQKRQGRSGHSISSPGKTRQNVKSQKRPQKRGAQASSGGEGLLSPDKARHSIRAAAPCNSGALSDGAAEQRGDKM